MKARPADGKVISAAGTTLRAWDATDGRLLWVTEFSNEIKDMTVSRAQDVIVLCAGGGLWKVDGTRGSVVEDHRAIIGRYVFLCCVGGTLWKLILPETMFLTRSTSQ